MEFSEKFGVDFMKMDYETFLIPEHEVANGKWLLLTPIMIPYILLKLMLKLLIFPFSRSLSNTIANYDVSPFIHSYPKDVSMGDLMVSVIKKEFAEKEKIRIELVSA